MKCVICGNDREEGFCAYCNWKGNEGPGKIFRDTLVKEYLTDKKDYKVISKEDFIKFILDNFETIRRDIEDALESEQRYLKECEFWLKVENIEEDAVRMCYNWAMDERKPIKPEDLFTFRKSALYFRAIQKK